MVAYWQSKRRTSPRQRSSGPSTRSSAASRSAKRQVACDASRGEQSTLNVACANTGSAYAQVREVLVKDGERVLGRFEGGAYILPGARKVLPIKAENIAPGARLQLVVSYDDGRSESFDVTVG